MCCDARRMSVLAFAVSVLATVLAIRAELARAEELPIKIQAAYLFNFTRFVEWPADGARLVVCVVGAELLGELLDDLARRPNAGPALQVKLGWPDNPAACQLLYLSRREPRRAELLRQSRGQPVLTVSDAPDFIAEGGLIGFYLDDGRLKVAVNAAAARAAGLKLSGKLLEVARVVE